MEFEKKAKLLHCWVGGWGVEVAPLEFFRTSDSPNTFVPDEHHFTSQGLLKEYLGNIPWQMEVGGDPHQ